MGRVYRVAQAGLGAQGLAHLEGQTGNPGSFSLEAVCDLYGERLDKVCAERPGVGRYSEAERMLDEVRPDVFTFVTQPDVRLEMVRLAVRYGVKVLVFEKPMALSLADAAETVRTLREAGIKSVVCHQHKYQHTFRKMKEIVDSGAIGKVTQINFSTQAWMAQMGTHFMDYAIWANDGRRLKWVAGHAHGRKMLADSHVSPDYIMGQAEFEGGVRLFLECGYLSRPNGKHLYLDNRLTLWCEKGYAWAELDAWGACVGGELMGGGPPQAKPEPGETAMGRFYADLAKWLDEGVEPPCAIDMAYHGYEVLAGLIWGALDNRPVTLPIDVAAFPDLDARLRMELPD